MVYVKNINLNIPTMWKSARGTLKKEKEKEDKKKKIEKKLSQKKNVEEEEH